MIGTTGQYRGYKFYFIPFGKDDAIERLEKNRRKCLWCNFKFNCINATEALLYSSFNFRTKCTHIKRRRASIRFEIIHLLIYDGTYIKSNLPMKGYFYNDHSLKNDLFSIYHAYRNKSSEVVVSSRIYPFVTPEGMYSSNITRQRMIHHPPQRKI